MAGRPKKPSASRRRTRIGPSTPSPRPSAYDDELLGGGRRSSGSAYDDAVLGGWDGRPGYDTPLERQYRRQYPHLAPGASGGIDDSDDGGGSSRGNYTLIPVRGDRLRAQLQRDRALPWGAESDLTPHSTIGQSIEPNRPRTVAAGYNHMARELRVKFRDGARYVYYGVPPEVWEGMLSADSVGGFMNDHVVHSYMYDQETYNRR